MFNILDFIDSPDIREFNKNTQFTPAEQVILITRSCGTTLDEKISALQEIVDNNTEETYQTDSIKIGWSCYDECNFSKMISKTLEIWKNILTKCKEAKNVVYILHFEEKEYCKPPYEGYSLNYYSTYDLAYQAMLKEKQKYLEDEDTETFAGIRCLYIDSPDDYDEFLFDNDLRLIKVYLSNHIKEEYGLIDEIEETCYMHVPLPFKKGDLIKVYNPFYPTQYGVRSYDSITKDKNIHFINDSGDGSDMITSIDVYNERYIHKFHYTDDTPILDMQLCKEEDLPEGEKMLLDMREVILGELNWIYLLYHNNY